jgi:uncharacterized membrane protein
LGSTEEEAAWMRATFNPTRAVWLATIIYAGFFFALGVDRYATFHSGADLGLFVQTIDSAFAGFHNTVEGTSHFAYHFSPILYLCAPLLWLTHSALSLVALQAIATALIAPALYLIARRRTGEANAALLACVALLYPPLQGVTFTDFHETAFLPAGIAWLLWAVDARRFWIGAALLVLVLGIKEDQSLAMAFVGVVGAAYFARRSERGGVIFCCAAIAISLAVFAAYFAIVRPMAGSPVAWHPFRFYDWLAPDRAMPFTWQIGERSTYLLEVFVPLAFVPFRSRALLLAFPGLFEVLASQDPLMYTMGQYYAAVWVPYVLVAFALGGAKLLEAGKPRWIYASATLCALVLLFFNPLHPGHFLRWPNGADTATHSLIARVPHDASIGTYDEIYAHLGFDPNARIGLSTLPRYVLADDRYHSLQWDTVTHPRLRRLMAEGVYRVAASDDGVTLYERTGLGNEARGSGVQ